MDAADLAFAASKLARVKINSEFRKASVMIENDLSHEECAHALAALLAQSHVCVSCGGVRDKHEPGCYLTGPETD